MFFKCTRPYNPMALCTLWCYNPLPRKLYFSCPTHPLIPEEDHLWQYPPEDSIQHLQQATYPSLGDNSMMAGPSWDSPAVKGQDGLATLSTVLSATEPPVTSYTCVKSVAPVTAPASAPAGTVWLPKPTPWTPL